MEIKQIKSENEKKEYNKLCRYCFEDDTGWIDRQFGKRKKGETIYGAFENGALKSGIVCKYYTVNLFGALHEMAGISVVASYPEVRNKGYIRQLFEKALYNEYSRGTTVSALYPFSFRYYSKFGYGQLGPAWNVGFSPDDIIPLKNTAPLVPFDGSAAMFTDIKKVQGEYYTAFDFGAVPDERDVSFFNDEIALFKQKVYISYDGRQPTAVLAYTIKPGPSWGTDLHITSLSWTQKSGLHSSINHLASHRGQCNRISGVIHPSVPLHLFTKEPRLETKLNRTFMARPLNLESVLKAKLREGRSFKPVVFSVEDPVLERETASYEVSTAGINKTAFTGKNAIPLPLFSSLLFGGITPREACDALYDQDWILESEDFFAKNNLTFLNERF